MATVGSSKRHLNITSDSSAAASTMTLGGNGVATEAYVGTQITNLIDSSPSALNTLNELAAALGDDASFSTTVTNSIATKLPLAAGSGNKLTDALYIQGTNTTNQESVLIRGISSNDGDWLGSIRTANTGGYNQEMRFYTSNANGTSDEDLTLTLHPTQNATFASNIYAGGDLTVAGGDVTVSNQNDAPTFTLLHDGTNPSTNDLLFKMQFQSDYNGSHQNWGKIVLETNSSATRTDMDFYVKSASGAEQVGLRIQGGASTPKAYFFNDVDVDGDLTADNFSGSSSGTNTGDQVLPTLSSLGALSTTGKAADSNLLDGIDSGGFTRKYTFNPGSTASGNRYYAKLFTLDDFDAGVTGILSAAGDYGDADKASYEIQIGTRTTISFDVYQTSHSAVADDYEFYYRQAANNDYEIWALMSDYNQNNQFTVLSQFGTVTYNFDSASTSAPNGLTEVTKHTIYHSGNLTPLTIGTTATTAMAGNTSLFDGAYSSLSGLPTLGTAAATASSAYATSAQGTRADDALPKAGGTVTGTLTVQGDTTFFFTKSSDKALSRIIPRGVGADVDKGLFSLYAFNGTSSIEEIRLDSAGSSWIDGGSLGIGTTNPTYKLDVAGNAGFNEYIYHNGDSNTYIRLTADRVRIVAGGTTKFDSDSTYLTSVAFSDLTGTPTTISGYGITDALAIGTTSTTAMAGNTAIPSGNAIIDWTTDQGSTNIHSGNYTDTVYVHPTGDGNNHIPTGGSSGQFLRYSSSGTATWATPSYTTNTDNQLSQADVIGMFTAGNNVTIASDGTINSTDTDTVYTHPTTAGNKHIPAGGAAGQFLKYSSDGTATWATPSYTTNTNTTYSAGTGLDLTGTTFSIESDLRDGVTRVGKDTSNYIAIGADTNVIDFYVGGVWVARMESDGDLHMKGDVIAFSDIFNP